MPNFKFKYGMDSHVHFFRLFCGRDENLMRFKNSSHKNLCFSDNRMTSYFKRDYCSILQEEIFRLRASPDDANLYRPRPKVIIHKSNGGVSLVEQDTIENVS